MRGSAGPCDHGGVLELTDLRRTFGPVTALDGLSFAVTPGKLFGFVGRNGAGKTTTMRIVCGLLAADSGTVTWRRRPVDAALRRRIGYMPEERGLYPKMQAGITAVNAMLGAIASMVAFRTLRPLAAIRAGLQLARA